MYREFDLIGRKWRVGKFLPKAGSRIAWIFAGRTSQLGILPELTDGEFDLVYRESLGVCEELLAAGWTKVLDPASNFMVIGLEHDSKTVWSLMGAALSWNLPDFSESPLTSQSGDPTGTPPAA